MTYRLRAWVEPSAQVLRPAEQERVRLLAALLLGLLVFAGATTVLQLVFVPSFYPTTFWRVMGALALLSLAYGLSRTRWHQGAAVIAVAVPLVATCIMGLTNPDDVVWWGFATLSPLLATMFFSTRSAAFVAGLTLVAVVLVLWVTRGSLTQPRLVGPIAFHATFQPLLVIAAINRNRLEQQRQLELQVREAALAESRRMETVGRLAGGIAHDFNNLLMVVIGNASLLATSAEGDARESAHEIQDAAKRAAELTRQLLAFAKRQPVSPRPVDLGQLVSDLTPIMQRLVGEGVQLRVDRRAQRPVVVADPSQLEQVLMNLVANARDAMRAVGTLDVSVDDEPTQPPSIALVVRDTGVGMDEATRSRIFEPFFTTRQATGGTGLGLATVKSVVEACGGTVSVTSQVGVGSAFRVVLPLTEAQPEPAPASGPVEPVRGPRRKVLLVEDEPAIRRMLARALEAQGFELVVAGSGEEALTFAEGRPVDVLVSDVVMPGLGGAELAARLRARSPGLPVIFMSGYAAESAGVVSDAATTVLAKPLSAEALGTRIRELTDHKP